MALLFPQQKVRERRKNRGQQDYEIDEEFELCMQQNVVMRKALAQIANITKRECPDDDECRLEMQSIAHKAITDTGEIV